MSRRARAAVVFSVKRIACLEPAYSMLETRPAFFAWAAPPQSITVDASASSRIELIESPPPVRWY